MFYHFSGPIYWRQSYYFYLDLGIQILSIKHLILLSSQSKRNLFWLCLVITADPFTGSPWNQAVVRHACYVMNEKCYSKFFISIFVALLYNCRFPHTQNYTVALFYLKTLNFIALLSLQPENHHQSASTQLLKHKLFLLEEVILLYKIHSYQPFGLKSLYIFSDI